jgi:hypothetical protein
MPNQVRTLLYTGIMTHDCVNDDGYDNLGEWVESAYQRYVAKSKRASPRLPKFGAQIGARFFERRSS